MDRFPAFLNELSCSHGCHLSEEDLRSRVLSTLDALKALKKVRENVIVIAETAFAKTPLNGGTQSFASLLRGDDYRDDWRFIKELDQRSPFEALENCFGPHADERATFNGYNAVGILWAKKNASVIVSFGIPPHWS